MQGVKKSALKGVADNLRLSPPKHEHQSNPVLSQKGTPGETRITSWKYLEFVFQKIEATLYRNYEFCNWIKNLCKSWRN